MVLPLLALAGAGVATGAGLYEDYNQRKLYREEKQRYTNLYKGYSRYLSNHGRKVNPNRAWSVYGSKIARADMGIKNSYARSVGRVAGFAGSGIGMKMYGNKRYNTGYSRGRASGYSHGYDRGYYTGYYEKYNRREY